ncbi:CD151 antigen-like isoform X2 [Physella acuta]|nr:CD151 antigen-like isoform X2 [Physella acuta]XP_059155548.1 CD151 antigen-like isoform X2 [Physella acuta]XP_059155549.1 CD151 antigen-like isoform X2 [Physella acuta]
MNCFKILLFIFNIFFILVGIALAAVGIWSAVAKIYVSHVIGDSLFGAASYLLIAVGVFIIIVCILGILGLCQENKKWLMIYFGFLIFNFIVLIVAAVLAIVFKGEVENVMVDNMRETMIKNYGIDKEITDAWNQLQKDLECCALSQKQLGNSVLFSIPYKDGKNPANPREEQLQDSWPIYKRTEFYNRQLRTQDEKKFVPESCCVYDNKIKDYKSIKHCQNFPNGPPNQFITDFKNDYLHYAGCYEKAKDLVMGQSDIIVALGFVFAFIMIAGMVITFFLLRSFVDVDDEIKRRREPDNL